MQMPTDDEVYSVDNVFLGPPRLTFPWRARYQAYAVGALLAVAGFVVLNLLGLLGFWPIAYMLLAVVGATRWISPHITHDFPVRAAAWTTWNEARAPRSARPQPIRTAMSARGIRRRAYLR